MPTYEYQCDACNHNFDEFQSMKDDPLTKCPKCGKKKLRRVYGAGAAVIFKGSGFYQTDYRSESYTKAARADQEAAKPASNDTGGTNGTTDSGSAAKGTKETGPGSKSPKSSV
jgi:putative FmdB family regulatory protein